MALTAAIARPASHSGGCVSSGSGDPRDRRSLPSRGSVTARRSDPGASRTVAVGCDVTFRSNNYVAVIREGINATRATALGRNIAGAIDFDVAVIGIGVDADRSITCRGDLAFADDFYVAVTAVILPGINAGAVDAERGQVTRRFNENIDRAVT